MTFQNTNMMGATAEEVGVCFFCGEVPELDILMGPGNEFDLCGCCLASHEARSIGGYTWGDVYGIELQEALQGATGTKLKAIDGLPTQRWGTKLSSRFEKSRNVIKAFVAAHHSHNPNPPAGDRARFVCHNGPTLVGVAMLGNPARKIRDTRPTWIEVTRVCVGADFAPGLRRNACTKLYAEAFKWARKNPDKKTGLAWTHVITYTRVDEDGTSCKAAGFVQDPTYVWKGGNFGNRPGRKESEDIEKIRWIKEL